MNRYYSSTIGRFLTPDPYHASGGPKNPQSWNRYAYVTNDPVGFYDPSGLDECPGGEVCVIGGDGSGSDNGGTGDSGGGGGGGGTGISPAQQALEWADTHPDSGSNKLWNKDLTILGAATSFLAWTMNNLPGPCQGDINDLDNSDLTGSSDQVSAQAIVDQSESVALVDAQGNTNLALWLFVPGSQQWYDQLAAGSGQTIANYVSSKTQTDAATALPGSLLYGAIFFAPGDLSKMTNAQAAALLMHELIHTLGLTDTQIQSALFGPESPKVGQASENITDQLYQDCF
jgi:hypothetical protein